MGERDRRRERIKEIEGVNERGWGLREGDEGDKERDVMEWEGDHNEVVMT
jgi:hypothetical protein